MTAPDARFRVAAGVLVELQADGALSAWLPKRRAFVRVEPDAAALLLRFGAGQSIAEAAEAAGLEVDDTALSIAREFVSLGLLLPMPAAVAAAGSANPGPSSARARLARLTAGGEVETLADTGAVITAALAVDGLRVLAVAFEPLAGTGGADAIEAILAVQERARAERTPIVYLFDTFSIGRDLEREFTGPRGIGRVYATMARLAGVAPQIGVVLGPVWRPAAFPPALCDVLAFGPEGRAHVGDASAVLEFTGEQVDDDDLGGGRMHASVSGLADARFDTEDDALAFARAAVLALGRQADTPRPPAEAGAPVDRMVPDDHHTAYDVRRVIAALTDEGSPLELGARFARELITGFARLEGRAIGVVANAPDHKGGLLTPAACRKAARFVARCDGFGLPLLFLVDVPGFQIGKGAEQGGILEGAADLFGAVARARVPRLVLVLRKAHTAGLYAMGGPGFDPTVLLALPGASIAIFGERALVPGAAELARELGDRRAALDDFLRAQRSDPARVAEIVPLSGARARLARALSGR